MSRKTKKLFTLLLLAVLVIGISSPANPSAKSAPVQAGTASKLSKTFGSRDTVVVSPAPANPANASSSEAAVPAPSAASQTTTAGQSLSTNIFVATKTVPSPTATKKLALTTAERDRVERVIMASCGELGNPLMAMANAQVILDRTSSGRFGNNVDQVLAAPGQFEKPWNGSVNPMVKDAVSEVFDYGERVTPVRIFYYINPYHAQISLKVWEKDKRYVETIGKGQYIHQYWTDKT